MKNTLIKCLEQLINENDPLNTYECLAKIFEETEMYHEQAGILEKIYNINKNYFLYMNIGDIFAEKLKNYVLAQRSYEIYLAKSRPIFYEKYSYILDKLGMSLYKPNDNDQDELLGYADRYVAGIYIFVLLAQRKEYDVIVKCADKMKNFENHINEIAQNYPNNNCLNDIADAKNHLARELAKIDHHNDINKFAITLDPDYEAPYLNIIEDLLTYKNYDEAIEFYNNVYAPKFNQENKSSYIDLHWFISDKYSAYGQPFNSVKFQQMAIELELEKRGK